MSDLIWTPITIRLGQVRPWQDNPRLSTRAQAQRLIRSWRDLGQMQTIAVGPMVDGHVDLYDGHQRVLALNTVKTPDYELVALQSNRPLTDDERHKAAVLLHTATGGWNWDSLSSWSAADLREWGMDADSLKDWQADVTALKELLASEGGEDETYSRKIEAPIYTPKGDKPALSELYNEARTKELLAEIDAAELPEDEKQFLRVAAQRHTVLNFKRIAEYYAHSPAPVQRLMENSALIIIDFKRAIELGYVKLSEEIAAQYLKDYPDAG